MMTPWEFFLDAVLPALVTVAAALVGWMPWTRREPASLGRGRVAVTVATAGAFMLGWGLLFGGLKSFPPTDATSWVVFAVPVIALWGVFDGLFKFPPPVRIGVALVLVSVFAYVLVRPLVLSEALESTQGASAMGGTTVLALAWWASVELLERRGFARGTEGQNGLTSAGVLLALTGTTAVVLGTSGSVSFGQKAGLLAAAVGGLLVVATGATARGRRTSLAHGTVLVVVTGTALMLATGKFYSEVTWWNVLLVVLIPFTPWLAELGPVRRWTTDRPVRAALVRVALAGVPALISLTLSGLAFYQAMKDRASDPY